MLRAITAYGLLSFLLLFAQQHVSAATTVGDLQISEAGKVTITLRDGEVQQVPELPNGDLQLPAPNPPNEISDQGRIPAGGVALRYFLKTKNGILITSYDFEDRLAAWTIYTPLLSKTNMRNGSPNAAGETLRSKDLPDHTYKQERLVKRSGDILDIECQYLIGLYYWDDLISVNSKNRESEVEDYKDEREAFKWMLRAATYGHPMAQRFVGRSYQMGWGVTKDLSESTKWYRRSADQGNAAGLLALSEAYRLGRGVPKDQIEGCAYINLAAAKDERLRPIADEIESTLPPEARLLAQQRSKQLQKEIEDRKAAAEEAIKAANGAEKSRGA